MNSYGKKIEATYKVIGEPVNFAGPTQLAEDDPYKLQWWTLGLVGARPVEKKKGADKGIDGRMYFHDGAPHPSHRRPAQPAGASTPASPGGDHDGAPRRRRPSLASLTAGSPGSNFRSQSLHVTCLWRWSRPSQ